MKQYNVTGMSCAACSARVEKAVGKVPGVTACSVSLLTNSMGVEGTAEPSAVIAAVEAAGYGASEKGAAPAAAAAANQLEDHETPRIRRRLIWSVGFLLVLMYFSMGHMMWGWPLPPFYDNNHVAMGLTQLLLTVIIMVINQRFFISGYRALWHRAPNMDTLVALGATAAFGYSTYALFAMTAAQVRGDEAAVMTYMMDFYFESAAMILTLITVGKYLESRSKGKTSEAITKLMNLAPKVAVLVTGDGQEKEVPTESLQKGDIFLVKPGSLVPVDGIVLEGNSSVDEAAITGESVPVEKQAGDHVVSATVNKAGFLKCRADRVGDDTTLAQIIRLVEEASASKAPIAQLADKVAGVFVPTVMAISLITLIVWLASGATAEFAISTAIAVLVISCPCALGLATPVAIMVGTGVGASNGILIKTGEALQQAKEIDTVVLDKTGTITSGKLKVEEAGGYQSDFPVDAMMQIAAALEKKSEHPLAEAVVEWAEQFGLAIPEIVDFKATFGRGVEGTLAAEFHAEKVAKKDGPTAVFYAGKRDSTADVAENSGNIAEQNPATGIARSDADSVTFPAGTKFYVGNLSAGESYHSAGGSHRRSEPDGGRRHDTAPGGAGRKILRHHRCIRYCQSHLL